MNILYYTKKNIRFSLGKLAVFCCLFLLFLTSCQNKSQKSTDDLENTRIELTQPTFNFGKITSGETVSHTYSLKNTGDHYLIIKNIQTSCGCTTVDYPKEPIAPGKEGKLEIAFNSSGRYGKQYKEIRIFANIPEKVVTLKFTADIQGTPSGH
ncbi:DUF1573 domain-containing protein [Odoribacter laneus]|uniref:DUF1573 domain-containing protein n=1 Tax=Odoribacter laneus TaxID=626933 RepID=UPI0039935BB8